MKKCFLFSLLLLICACRGSHKNSESELNKETPIISDVSSQKDTTIYEYPPCTAVLENPHLYFKENNRMKDWNSKDRKMVVVKCVVEKDSSVSYLRVVKSESKIFDEEAIRLIRAAKVCPAKDDGGNIVRSWFTIPVHFPFE